MVVPTRKRKSKNYIPLKQFLKKWKESPPPKPTAEMLEKGWKFVDGVVYENCGVCGESLPRTTDYFTAQNVNLYGGVLGWFEHYISGCESFLNGKRGCHSCYGNYTKKRHDTPDGIIWSVMSNYKGLHVALTDEEKLSWKIANPLVRRRAPPKDGGMRFYKQHAALPCAVTGCPPSVYVFEKSHALSMSINRMDVRKENEDYSHDSHIPSNTAGVQFWINVKQGHKLGDGRYEVYIPCLRAAFRDLCIDVAANYLKTPDELDAEISGMYELLRGTGSSVASSLIKRFVSNRVSDMKRIDKAKCRVNDLTVERIVEKLRSCGMRCATTGVLVSFQGCGPRTLHLDRIDDTIGHTFANVEVKIGLFSNKAKLSRKMYLHVFLTQTVVELSSQVRALAQADFDGIAG